MKRKVIQIAGSTQLISLPRQWALRHNVQKGDELDVQEQGNKVVVSTDSSIELSTKVIDVSGLDRSSIIFYLRSAYRKGYDAIDVKYADQYTTHLRTGEKKKISAIIHDEISRLVGVEVIQQKENSCLVKSISEASTKDFNNILRRIFILLNDAFDDILNGVKTGNTNLLETIEERHDGITKFISYSLRLLNKKGYEVLNDITSLYHIVSSLEQITDILKWAARDMLDNKTIKFSDRGRKIMELLASAFGQYYDLFYKFEPKKVFRLYEIRHEALSEINSAVSKVPLQEALILNYTSLILDILVAVTEVRMGIESPK